MASSPIATDSQANLMQNIPKLLEEEVPSRFDLMFGRMKGTVIIHADIINPDPEFGTARLSNGLLLDTHASLWFATADQRISASAARMIADATNQDRLFVAAMSLYEMANMARRNRVSLTMPVQAWFDVLLAEPQVAIVALDADVALATTLLPDTFHGDPGDRLIAASAIVRNLTLCTHDRNLIRFGKQGIYNCLEI